MSLYRGIDAGPSGQEIICDLRSDTATCPDTAMRAAMARAEVGDDCRGEDPSVKRLEQTVAKLLGQEAATFFPTATQSNLSAVMAHCQRGDEVLVGEGYHLLADEAAGASVLADVALQPLSVGADMCVDSSEIEARIKPDDPHCPVSRLLSLENTVSGIAIPLARIRCAAEAAREHGLAIHLDGARLLNATTELGVAPAELGQLADTVTLCLSKGLGAPAGAVLAGNAYLMRSVRRARKILGGAMRQAGVLAAAGLYALENNSAGLIRDHQLAADFSSRLRALGCGHVRQATNMVHFEPPLGVHEPLRVFLSEKGILIGAQEPAMRLVFHRDVDPAAITTVIEAIEAFFEDASVLNRQPV